MHRDPFSERNERRVSPSSRAQEAANRWLAKVGGEEAYKRTMAEQLLPSSRLLDMYADRWAQSQQAGSLRRLHQATVNERVRELRRIRRQLRLAIVISALAVGSALALVVWYGILGNH